MVYVIVIVVLVVIALSFQGRRCPACDFTSYDEADAQRHAEEHARHRPTYR